MNENNILGVILAGGKSRRFGEDKSNIKLGNKTLLEHAIDKVKKEFSELLIISNSQNYKFTSKRIFLVQDFIKGQLGPLIGVLSAMKWVELNKKNYKWIATFPCDTPFFDIIDWSCECSSWCFDLISITNFINQIISSKIFFGVQNS